MFDSIKKFFADLFKGTSFENDHVVPEPHQEESSVTDQKFPLGAFPNEPDNRDIPYEIVKPVAQLVHLPTTATVMNFLTTVLFQQGGLGTCVPHALEFIRRMKDNVHHSRRVPYVLTRNFLGWTEADGQGLPQRDAAKIFTGIGTPKEILALENSSLSHKEYASLVITDDMKKDANTYRFGGFAFPQINVTSFKNAIANGDAIAITVAIDWDVMSPNGTLHAPKKVYGYHEIVIGQYDDEKQSFKFANWWGEQWGSQGYGYIPYAELEKIVIDAITFVPISEDLKERARNVQYIFNTDLKIGTVSDANIQLQRRLKVYGFFNAGESRSFGPITLQAVKDYQRLKGISQTGFVGPVTRAALNADMGIPAINSTVKKSKLDLWCEAATKMEGAKPELHNPGNIKCDSIMNKDATGKDSRGFCIFPTEEKGYNALRNMFIRACTTGSTNYKPTMSLYQFYAVYAPSSDANNPNHYAEFVAQYIGVDPNAEIKNIIA